MPIDSIQKINKLRTQHFVNLIGVNTFCIHTDTTALLCKSKRGLKKPAIDAVLLI